MEEEAERTEKEKQHEFEELLEMLKLVAPGTKLRAAIDDIARAGRGALIVIGDSPEVLRLAKGGFKLDCPFTPQRLVELSKMDGAIILADNVKRIVYCNTLLVPDPAIETDETGARHQAAERTAKQTSKPVIAISEHRKTKSLYYKSIKYTLKEPQELLARAAEDLRMLEKQKEILTGLLRNLDILELTGLVSLHDVIMCLQRIELTLRIAQQIERYLIELGAEGSLVKIALRELVEGLPEQRELLIKDYSRNKEFSATVLPSLSFDELVEVTNVMRALLYSSLTDPVEPRGYRLLAKTGLDSGLIEKVVEAFKDFRSIMAAIDATPETQTLETKLTQLLGEKEAQKVSKALNSLKNQALVNK